MKLTTRTKLIFGGVLWALVALIGALCALFRPNGDVAAFIQHPATTGWAQSVGSFAAVTVALGLAYMEGRRHRAAERAARLERLQVVLLSAGGAANYLTRTLALADKLSRTSGWFRGAPQAFIADVDAALQALKAVAPNLPNRDAHDAVMRLVAAGHAARADLAIAERTVDVGGTPGPETYGPHLLAGIDARAALQTALASAGADTI